MEPKELMWADSGCSWVRYRNRDIPGVVEAAKRLQDRIATGRTMTLIFTRKKDNGKGL